ncbi:MAG: ANTAR domain-containing protein [Microthrixaceae bacterium]
MTSRGYTSLLRNLTSNQPPPGPLHIPRLCEDCATVFGLDGTSILIESAGGGTAGLSTWGDATAELESQQFVLGEGPGIAAQSSRRPEFVPDTGCDDRFPLFAAAAAAVGFGAAFAFPLGVGLIRLGVLSMYRTNPGDLDERDFGDGVLVADIVTALLLAEQAAQPGTDLPLAMEDPSSHRAVVHQATGMVSVQLGCGLDEALVRIRAHAFATGAPLDDVARRIVERTLRLEPDVTSPVDGDVPPVEGDPPPIEGEEPDDG